MNAITIAIALVVGIVIGVDLACLFQRRSRRLQKRFGPEYSLAVAETGDRWKAEFALEHRAKRAKRLHVHTLTPAEHPLEAWCEVQGRFVDDPNGSLVEADRLIARVMSAEGYPVADFEQRLLTFPSGIVLKDSQGRADTEDLRQGIIIHYRTLFEDLLGEPECTQTGRTVR